MNTNSSAKSNSYDTIPGEPVSYYLPLQDAPDISQACWYDIEDGDTVEPERAEQPITVHRSRIATAYNTYPPGPEDGDEPASNSSPSIPAQQFMPSQTVPHRATDPGSSLASSLVPSLEVLRKIVSLRTIIILAMIAMIAGGAAFAKNHNFYVPSSRTIAQISPPRQEAGSIGKTLPVRKPMPTPIITATSTVPSAMSNLPIQWIASGRNIADATEVIAVAETFTQRYETLDYRSVGTLSAAIFILTPTANARFTATNKRSTQAFAQQLQQQRHIQATIISGAELVKAESQNGSFFAWVTVTYQLVTQQGTGAPTLMNNLHLTVLLVAVPFNSPHVAPPMGGLGWLVSGFAGGNTLPDIPAIP